MVHVEHILTETICQGRVCQKSVVLQCSLDPVPTWLIKRISTTISPILCHMCNLSFHYGICPTQPKQARVIPRLKNPHWTQTFLTPTDPSPICVLFQNSWNVLFPSASSPCRSVLSVSSPTVHLPTFPLD